MELGKSNRRKRRRRAKWLVVKNICDSVRLSYYSGVIGNMEKADFRVRLREVPHQPGVYLMKDRIGSIIYVGKAKDLRKRLSSYFMASRKMRADAKTRALIEAIWDFEIHVVRNEQESLLLEGKLIKDYRPRYNVAFRDDKQFLLVKINVLDPWPRLMMTRLKKDDQARYFGPFAHSTALRATVEWLNRSYGLRVCRPNQPGELEYKHCNADVIRNCSAPCVARITGEQYHQRIDEVCRLLEGKGRRDKLDELREEMSLEAEAMHFEKAALLRDVIQNLEITLNPTRQFTRGRGLPTTVKPTEDLAELGEWLQLSGPPRVMECFDISNVSSNHIVASMVRFVDGVADNQAYRRYRIKTVSGQDDFASMAEVVRRRYSRILLENAQANPDVAAESQENVIEIQRRLARDGKAKVLLPDLVIVDGGKGQLSMAVAELRKLKLHELPVIGLAKQREEVFRPGHSEPILIPHDRGALKLLQRIRDEAHRFANGYNSLLLRRRMKESVLDDCPLINAARKKSLFKHFGSVTELRKATCAEIEACPGINQAVAQALFAWLEVRK
jgi:excinuclease ABC subunit C